MAVVYMGLRNARAMKCRNQYGLYSTSFQSQLLNYYSSNRLDELFDECLTEVKSRDPTVGPLISFVQSNKPPATLLTGILAKHSLVISNVILESFNADLMRQLRSSVDTNSYQPWMTRALKEWTHPKNKKSQLVEQAITKLVGKDNEERLANWLIAYLFRDTDKDSWNEARAEIRKALRRYVGQALTDGEVEVEAIVVKHFPSCSATPDLPKQEDR